MVTQLAAYSCDYSRLEKTIFERSRIRTLKTLVVGAGALGNEVVKTLGLLGVGRIAIVDPDVVEASNLTRSVLFRTPEALGRNKAIALTEAAERLFPDTSMIGIGREIADLGFQEINSADIVFSCLDSDLARLETAYISTKLDLPVVDAGLGMENYSHGRTNYFPGRRAACFGCRLTAQRRRELLTLWDSAARPCGVNTAEAEGGGYPSTPTMAAVVGAMQVELGLRRLLGGKSRDPDGATTVEISFNPAPKLETFSVPLGQDCPFHEDPGVLIPGPEPPSALTVQGLLDRAENGGDRGVVLVLDWPICTRARCRDCGFSWPPMQRLATVRRRGRCPGCGSREIQEQETIRSVDRKSPWASVTLAELGLPNRHLHTIRFTRGRNS